MEGPPWADIAANRRVFGARRKETFVGEGVQREQALRYATRRGIGAKLGRPERLT